jgi:dihydrofolate reductase
MGSVVIDMSMSLDGYIAAPNDTPEQGLGEDGMRLHDWALDHPSVFERGIERALAKAQEAAAEKRIGLMGANIDQQFLAAGLVDEIRIHLVNVLLGGGRRLFDQLPERIELEQTGLDKTDGVTHLEYRVVR